MPEARQINLNVNQNLYYFEIPKINNRLFEYQYREINGIKLISKTDNKEILQFTVYTKDIVACDVKTTFNLLKLVIEEFKEKKSKLPPKASTAGTNATSTSDNENIETATDSYHDLYSFLCPLDNNTVSVILEGKKFKIATITRSSNSTALNTKYINNHRYKTKKITLKKSDKSELTITLRIDCDNARLGEPLKTTLTLRSKDFDTKGSKKLRIHIPAYQLSHLLEDVLASQPMCKFINTNYSINSQDTAVSAYTDGKLLGEYVNNLNTTEQKEEKEEEAEKLGISFTPESKPPRLLTFSINNAGNTVKHTLELITKTDDNSTTTVNLLTQKQPKIVEKSCFIITISSDLINVDDFEDIQTIYQEMISKKEGRQKYQDYLAPKLNNISDPDYIEHGKAVIGEVSKNNSKLTFKKFPLPEKKAIILTLKHCYTHTMRHRVGIPSPKNQTGINPAVYKERGFYLYRLDDDTIHVLVAHDNKGNHETLSLTTVADEHLLSKIEWPKKNVWPDKTVVLPESLVDLIISKCTKCKLDQENSRKQYDLSLSTQAVRHGKSVKRNISVQYAGGDTLTFSTDNPTSFTDITKILSDNKVREHIKKNATNLMKASTFSISDQDGRSLGTYRYTSNNLEYETPNDNQKSNPSKNIQEVESKSTNKTTTQSTKHTIPSIPEQNTAEHLESQQNKKEETPSIPLSHSHSCNNSNDLLTIGTVFTISGIALGLVVFFTLGFSTAGMSACATLLAIGMITLAAGVANRYDNKMTFFSSNATTSTQKNVQKNMIR